jgi:hypothetical protein
MTGWLSLDTQSVGLGSTPGCALISPELPSLHSSLMAAMKSHGVSPWGPAKIWTPLPYKQV